MSEPVWVDEAVVLSLHDEQIAEHGGSPGVRDMGLLQSALARPRNLLGYGNPEISELAAAYAFGLARNHAFIDGNKRVSLVVTELFLGLNGFDLTASDEDCLAIWVRVAEGTIGEAELATWIGAHMNVSS